MAHDATTYAGVVIDGVTTIRWGTDGRMADSAKTNSGYYVVLDVQQEQVVAFNDKLPQGNGLTSTRVIGIDGNRWTVKVRDDTRMTPPTIGTTVSIMDMLGVSTVNTLRYGIVVESGYSSAVKEPGTRNITVERLTLVEGTMSAG